MVKDQSVSEQKRLASLSRRRIEAENQKSLISQALKNTNNSNKIRFDSDDEETPQKKPLFDDASDCDNNEVLNIKENVMDEKKCKKLLELQQKNFSNDERFRINEQFLDEESDGNNSSDEKEQQLAILSEVLGEPIRKRDKYGDEGIKPMVRYDPTEVEHSKFEINNDQSNAMIESPKRKKLKLDLPVDVPVIVPKEKFFKISENLKKSLIAPSSFSVLKTYGNQPEEKSDHEDNTAVPNWNKISLYKKNPLESSDSENDADMDYTERENEPQPFSQEWQFFSNTNHNLSTNAIVNILQKYEPIEYDIEERRKKLIKIITKKMANAKVTSFDKKRKNTKRN